MSLPSYRLLLAGSLLLVVAACADQAATAAAPLASAPLAVDLGGSARISRIAGTAGEGEGYDTMRAASATHASMAGMPHQGVAPMARSSATADDHAAMSHGVVNQSAANQGAVDHSKVDHGSMPAMNQAPTAAPQVAQAAQVQGTGTVNSVDTAGRKVKLNHNAIPAIGWPAMTMDFAVAPSVDMQALKPGTRVNFTLQRGGDGMYVVHSITPTGGQ